MKCERAGCSKQACTRYGSHWTLCKQHLYEYYPHFKAYDEDLASNIAADIPLDAEDEL